MKPVEGAVEVPAVSGGCLNEGLNSTEVGLGAGHVKVVHPLEVQPVVGSRPQSLSDSQGRVRRDRPATVDDVVDAYRGTPIVFARRYWVIPSSFMISARCSPGWIGSRVVMALLLVVVGDFDLHCAPVRPDKADAPLVVDSDAELTFPSSLRAIPASSSRGSTARWPTACAGVLLLRLRPPQGQASHGRCARPVLFVPDRRRTGGRTGTFVH